MRGLVTCGLCGSPVRAVPVHETCNTKHLGYYVCRHRTHPPEGKPRCVQAPYVQQSLAEAEIERATLARLVELRDVLAAAPEPKPQAPTSTRSVRTSLPVASVSFRLSPWASSPWKTTRLSANSMPSWQSALVQSEIGWGASEMKVGAVKSATAGEIEFSVTIEDVDVLSDTSGDYFDMSTLAVRIDVDIAP